VAAGAAGCASQAGNSVSSGPAGTLRVTVIQAGGPSLPGGKTPASPIADTEVKVTAGGASSTAETDKAGIATFHLAYGTYLVSVASCGSTTGQSVTVTTAPARLTWTCPVP
jgi:ABC-type phosphate transport system substrate-binding protein